MIAASINGLTLKNRIIKAANHEGIPQKAQGDTAMTTLAYYTSEANDRINSNMMVMDEYNRQPLPCLSDDILNADANVSRQLAHCGNFSKNSALLKRSAQGPSFTLNMIGLIDNTKGIRCTLPSTTRLA
jgi:2,4-dienoyl-CoA reductase-like NADH-dependent reductase (Old Yellow Enzyme family)